MKIKNTDEFASNRMFGQYNYIIYKNRIYHFEKRVVIIGEEAYNTMKNKKRIF
jgi:hypothetical protein